MNKDDLRTVLFAAVVCIALLCGDKLVLTPLMDLWSDRAERIVELEKSLNKGLLLKIGSKKGTHYILKSQ